MRIPFIEVSHIQPQTLTTTSTLDWTLGQLCYLKAQADSLLCQEPSHTQEVATESRWGHSFEIPHAIWWNSLRGWGKLLRKTGQSWWAVAASIERKQIKLIDRSSWIRSQWASQWRIWLATKNTCQQADLKITKAPSKGHLPFHAHEGHTSSWANDQQWTTRGSTVGDQVPQCIVGLKRNDYTSGNKKTLDSALFLRESARKLQISKMDSVFICFIDNALLVILI